MRVFTRTAVLFYMLLVWLVSGLAIAFVAHSITLPQIHEYVGVAYNDNDIRLVIGIISAVMILLSFLATRLIYGNYEQERTIAFDNPAGRVTVSLNALEDMIRRVILSVPDIKEVKSGVLATKKGLEADIRLILRSDMNIPEMTAQLQDLVKSKIQDTIGIDESVIVRIHVIKISTEDIKQKKAKAEMLDAPPAAAVPFKGYRP